MTIGTSLIVGFPGETEEVLIDATKHLLRQGDFVQVKIIKAIDYDLYPELIL